MCKNAIHTGLTRLLVVALLLCCQIGFGADRKQRRSNQAGKITFNPGLLRRAFQQVDETARLVELRKASANLADERLPEALRTAITINLRKQHVTESTLEAIRLFCRIDNEQLVAEQSSLASSTNSLVATVAAESLSQRKVPAGLDSLVELTARSEFEQYYGMRRTVVDSLARYPEPTAVKSLIGIMKQHPGQLRYEATVHLQRMTGQKLGGFPAKWTQWQNTNDFAGALANVPPETLKEKSTEKVAWPSDPPLFFNTDIYGLHILFVIDQSRSMLSTVDGKTRIKAVQDELAKAINELPESAHFNILAYNEGRNFWKKKPVKADAANKADSIRFAYSLSPNLMTNIHQVLKEAIRHDPGKLELIVFLSDGKPTKGRVVKHDQIIDSITRMNRNSRITLTTVGVDARGAEQSFLEELARRNSGVLRIMR